MSDNIDLTIVIVNYNAKDYLEKCLSSIYSNSFRLKYEIILVDNCSKDGSISMTRKKFPNVRIIENSLNEGFIKAANKGLKMSRGNYILSLNNDTVVLPESLEVLVKFIHNHPEAGACGPLVLNGDSTMQRQCKRGWPTLWNSFTYHTGIWKKFPQSKKWGKRFGGYFLLGKPDNEICEVDQLSGAAILVRRSVIEKVGFMNEDYVMFWDDTDWCFRIKEAGWKIYYVPLAKIIHYGGAGGVKVHAFKNLWYFHRGAHMFYRRYLAHQYFILVNFVYYIGVWSTFVSKLLINLFRKEKIIGSEKPI